MKTQEDTDLVLERVRAGEVEAFAEVVRAHQAAVWRTVAYTLRDHETVKDLVQQAFVNAYTSLDRFEAGADLGAWLRGIARNLVREELRRRAREDTRLEAYREHVEARLAGAGDGEPEDELRAALQACREKLPEPMQQALTLRYERGLGFDDVALTLGRTIAASRQLLQRVRLTLRDCIQGRLAGA